MRPLSFLPLALSPLLFVACTPVQGVAPVLYRASAADVLAVVAQTCPALTPSGAYRAFAVSDTTASSVLCVAKPLSVTLALNTYDPVTLRINAVQAAGGGPVSSVTGMQNWGGTLITNQLALSAVFAKLDQSFARVQ